MRKNWTQNEDTSLSKIVGQVGLNDWTAVANGLKHRYVQFDRTGKQCRQRWYNHLDPKVNKDAWNYQQELRLFQMHRQLGNRWKQMSLQLYGRTDNNIKNHFYSTLRRSLRRLNKVIGEKNSTLQMRQIKPSVLTIILNFIYDHQDENQQSGKQLLAELKDLPKLIFEFAQFKPVKGNMKEETKQENKQKIETIFNLIDQFKESYYQEKLQKNKEESEDFLIQSTPRPTTGPMVHPVITSEFKPLNKYVNIIVNISKGSEDSQPNQSSKCESGQKDKSLNEKFLSQPEGNINMFDLEEPSPLTSNNDRSFMDLVVIGHHWSPRRQNTSVEELNIDQILEINYE